MKHPILVLCAAVLLLPIASFASLKLAGTFTITEVMEKKVDLEGQLIRLKFASRSGITQVSKELYSTYLHGDGSIYVVFPREGLETMRKLSASGSKGDSIYGIIRSSFPISDDYTYSGIVLEAKGRTLSKSLSGKAKLFW